MAFVLLWKCRLYSSEIKSLTVERAVELVKRESKRGNLRLPNLTAIDKDVARALAAYDGYSLELDGLTSINKEVAKELAKARVVDIHLRGLVELDLPVAKELFKRKYHDWQRKNYADIEPVWDFPNLISINEGVAYELGKSEAMHLYLTGLTAIDRGTAKGVSEFSRHVRPWGANLNRKRRC